jgi:hypothetical protein
MILIKGAKGNMAKEIDGPAERISELWGDSPSEREKRWLWMYLKFFCDSRPQPSMALGMPFVETILQPKVRIFDGDIDAELEQMLRLPGTNMPGIKAGRFFIQADKFEWIESGGRQLLWLTDRVHNWLRVRIPDAEARFSGLDYLICLMDLPLMSILDKTNRLSQFHQEWLRHSKSTAYLNWFDDGDELARCHFAWEVLDSRLGSMISWEYKKTAGGAGLKCYFDALQLSEYEKKSHVAHIKKLWSQRRYRANQEKSKVRQRNFVLSDATMKGLDKLADQLSVSRTEALVRLIEGAVRHGMPGGSKAGFVDTSLRGDY